MRYTFGDFEPPTCELCKLVFWYMSQYEDKRFQLEQFDESGEAGCEVCSIVSTAVQKLAQIGREPGKPNEKILTKGLHITKDRGLALADTLPSGLFKFSFYHNSGTLQSVEYLEAAQRSEC